MMTNDTLAKLAVLLPHWAEHNSEHAEEFRQWAERAEQAGQPGVAQHVRIAAEALEQADMALSAALDALKTAGA